MMHVGLPRCAEPLCRIVSDDSREAVRFRLVVRVRRPAGMKRLAIKPAHRRQSKLLSVPFAPG
jgi:hypothetical protein